MKIKELLFHAKIILLVIMGLMCVTLSSSLKTSVEAQATCNSACGFITTGTGGAWVCEGEGTGQASHILCTPATDYCQLLPHAYDCGGWQY